MSDHATKNISETLPVQRRVGLGVVRHMTDDLSNIDAFVEEHGIEAVRRYLHWKHPMTVEEIYGHNAEVIDRLRANAKVIEHLRSSVQPLPGKADA